MLFQELPAPVRLVFSEIPRSDIAIALNLDIDDEYLDDVCPTVGHLIAWLQRELRIQARVLGELADDATLPGTVRGIGATLAGAGRVAAAVGALLPLDRSTTITTWWTA